jgi:hypothetical protein
MLTDEVPIITINDPTTRNMINNHAAHPVLSSNPEQKRNQSSHRQRPPSDHDDQDSGIKIDTETGEP